MKKFFRILLWVIVAAIFAGTFIFLYINSKDEVVRYNTTRPERGSIEKSTVLTGKIEPRDEIAVKPQISGIISEILVEAGEHVSEGDIIARIKVIPEASLLSSAQTRVNNAEIELADARVKYERDKALYDKKVISREEFETAEKNWQKAKEELEAARDAVNIVREGVSRFNASESNTLVRATITGLVLDVPVKVGSSVIQANTMNEGTTIATIADMNKLIFKGNVDETEVGLLRVGMPMEISIGAMPDLSPTAVIEYISPKGNDSGGANTFEIKAALQLDSSEGLRSGYSANASVSLSKAEEVLSVPEGVVSFEGDSTYVYVLTDSLADPQVFERRAITTGMSDGIKIEVKEGIDSTVVLRADKIKK
ncbi:MAG: efflux RND transporter periplasmic adaptor subunit [Muribaculaceae bacterium]|nr:efflux RND transporter periplasmic adaptor subunit [Muribaculaceae bacterium]